ncbi:MAG: PTS sorbitol transporter subunit IIA [Bombilactobacillus mellifer]|nr:PTS sorbitol transporter subunit IIA [Bombilactobacillus mellifer]
MKFKTRITRIGNQALNKDDQMVVLFGDNVTGEIARVSMSQKFVVPELQQKFELKIGQTVLIGSQLLNVNYVGSLVEENMRTICHINLFFGKQNGHLASAVYLDGNLKPEEFQVGNIITFNNE